MSTDEQQIRADKGKLQVGERAPLFSLPTQSGTAVSLEDFKGKIVVLYFYPKEYWTPVKIGV